MKSAEALFVEYGVLFAVTDLGCGLGCNGIAFMAQKTDTAHVGTRQRNHNSRHIPAREIWVAVKGSEICRHAFVARMALSLPAFQSLLEMIRIVTDGVFDLFAFGFHLV